MKRKIYVETSVISHLTARPSKTIVGAAHQQITLAWWETRNRYELLVSEPVLRECGSGDPDAATKRLAVLKDVPLLLITEQALLIAESLVQQGIIPTPGSERRAAYCGRHGACCVLPADMELSAHRQPGDAERHCRVPRPDWLLSAVHLHAGRASWRRKC